VERRILLRKLLMEISPKTLRSIKLGFKIAKPFLRKGFGDYVTATSTTACLLEMYPQIKQKVDEKSFAEWVLLQCADLRAFFVEKYKDGIIDKVKDHDAVVPVEVLKMRPLHNVKGLYIIKE